MRELSAQIDEMKGRWMTGGTAEPACPEPWRTALGDKPNLDLLALAGHFAYCATTPTAAELASRSALPRLALPTLGEDLRGLFRRVQASKPDIQGLLALLAARGVTAHPADWLPSASTDAPDVYDPWIDWVAGQVGKNDEDMLTAENWDDWLPSGRRRAFVELRRSNPAAARAVITEKAGDVPAEQRLRLVAELETGLSAADTEVLEMLASDRSGKVANLANSFLARLGLAKFDTEKIAEFTEFFETQKAGMLSRKEVVVARKLKTSAQRKRRLELAKAVPLSAFAAQLDVDPDDLVRNFELGDAAEELVIIVAATGSGAQASLLIERLAAQKDGADIDLLVLTARLDRDDRPALAVQKLKHDNSAFQWTRDMLGDQLGGLDVEPLLAAPAFTTLMKQLAKDDGRVAHYVALALTNLGLIATADASERLLNHFTTAAGLMAADPRLALLRLNAALKETP